MTTTTKPRKKTYEGPSSEEILLADLVALMESSELPPWRRPWDGHQGDHRNALTGASYRGANPILLELGGMIRGTTLPLWLGGAQAKAEGWFPKKGSKACRIIRPQLNKREEQGVNGETELRAWVSFKPVAVFNASELTGATPETQAALDALIAAALGEVEQREPAQRLETAEAALEAWAVPTTFGGARACYSPGLDQISMPAPEAFHSREAYCATWAHEQAHSTGHSSRLGRPMGGQFGSPSYAREELVAELASVLISYRLQIGCELQGHAAYLNHWAELLREGGPKTLFKVLSEARAAADLIAPEAPVDGAEA